MFFSRMSRRSFLNLSLGSMAGMTLGLQADAQTSNSQQLIAIPQKTFIPPLFCTAYITPDAPGQGGQEAMVAKYPLANVAQDDSVVFRRWRDKVKSLNPDILMLGYQVVIQETKVPGPGHQRLSRVKNSFCSYPGGFVPTVPGAFSGDTSRIYDPRTAEWRTAFLDACNDTLASYPYDGLFLDQCTVFFKASPFLWIREEMLAALRETLLELRKAHPNIISVGNSSYNFAGLNGEMNEGRPNDLQKEMAPFAGHVPPRIEMMQTMLRYANDINTVKREMAIAHAYGAFYGACVDGSHVLWFDEFDAVIAAFNKTRNKTASQIKNAVSGA
jgi:hypothetical protein